MTLFKLSLRNAKRQAKDYLVYFITVIMVGALIYAFNGVVFSQEIRSLAAVLDSLPLVIVLASVVVVGIIGWLIYYTTNFMLKKRSRELGTYILLGLENQQVARLFFLENLAVGGIALVLGIGLGNLLFQVLRAVLMTAFGITYRFEFVFSIKAVLLTLFYFALIYLFALIKSQKRIRRMKIYDLLYLNRQNEGQTIQKSSSRAGIFTGSIVLGIAGTGLLLTRNLTLGILGAAMIIAFLYGFFLSFSSGVPDYFNKRPAKKYEKQTLLVFRNLSSKLATMGVIMATIAVLFTATLLTEGTGIVLTTVLEARNAQTTCFDLFLSSTDLNEQNFAMYRDYIDENIPVTEQYSYIIYGDGTDTLTQYVDANTDYWKGVYEGDSVMRQSDYQHLRKMLGYPEAKLEAGEYTLHGMSYMQNVLKAYQEPLTVGGHTLKPGGVYTEIFTQSLWDGNGRGFIIIVPDAAAEALPGYQQVYAAMTETPVTSKTGFAALQNIRDEKNKISDGYDTMFSKGDAREEGGTAYAMMVFPLFYIAITLTMVAVTILTIQLLSESDNYRRQYALLDNLGMSRKEMKRALFQQFACFYSLPALPPVLISAPFTLAFCSIVDPGVIESSWQGMSIVALTLGIFFAIYFTYVITAYISFKRSVLPA